MQNLEKSLENVENLQKANFFSDLLLRNIAEQIEQKTIIF